MDKIKKTLALSMAFAGAVALGGCSGEIIDVNSDMANEYVRSFIEKYGVPQAGHDFCMAKLGTVTVRTDRPTDITVVSTVEGKNYTFDKAYAVVGEKTLSFDIPRDVNYVSVIANGRVYTARLGDVVSIDCVRQSRGNEGTDTKINVENYEMVGLKNDFQDGELHATDYETDIVSVESRIGHNYKMLGSELAQYISDDNVKYSGIMSEEYTCRNTDEHINILNVKAKPGQIIEVGRVYGDKPYLSESTHFILVPFMRNKEHAVKGDISYYYYTNDIHCWGHDLTIDYNGTSVYSNGIDGGNRGVISSVIFGVSDFCEYRNILNDSKLRSELEKYAAAQKNYNMPLPQNMHGGDTQFADAILEPYQVDNPLKFYDQWNDYINAWIEAQNDDVKSQFGDLRFVKEFLASRQILFKPKARPSVVETEPGKFKIEFFDSQLSNTGAGVNFNEISSYDPDMTYWVNSSLRCNLVGEDNIEYGTGTEFAYYIRDLNDPDGTIVTTTDKERVKTTHRHSSCTEYNGVHTGNESQIFMVDFDNDGKYNDFVFIPHHTVYGDSEPFSWRIASEDLGSTDDKDFNDLVVDVNIHQKGNDAQEISVTPYAAGGIYPLYLMFNDTKGNTFFVGKEIHHWLGQSTYDIYNTGEVDVRETVYPAKIKYDLMEQEHQFQISTWYNKDMGDMCTLGGFWVLVDKNNTLADKLNLNVVNPSLMTPEIKALIDADPGIYQVNNDPKYGENNALVPQMILVTNSWCWPREREDIGDAYEKFSSWVSDRNTVWYGSEAEGVNTSKITRKKPD